MSDPPPAQPLVPLSVLTYHAATGQLPEGWTNPSVHVYRAEAVEKFWRQQFWMTLRITVVIQLAGLGAMIWLLWDNPRALWIVVVLTPPVFLMLTVIRIFRSRRVFKTRWPTFRLIVADQGIVRSVAGLGDLVLGAGEISSIRESRQGMLIRGKRAVDLVLAARALDRYEEIRERLAPMCPIRKGGNGIVVVALVRLVAILGLYFAGMQAEKPAVQWACTAGVSLLAVWQATQVVRSPNLSLGQKITGCMTLLLPIIMVARLLLPAIMRRLFP